MRDFNLETKVAEEEVGGIKVSDFVSEFKRILWDPVYACYLSPQLRNLYQSAGWANESAIVQELVSLYGFVAQCLVRRRHNMDEPLGELAVTVERIFTLSSYDGSTHRVDGNLPENPSFGDSFSPLVTMIKSFSGLPTGTKIKVTMEKVE